MINATLSEIALAAERLGYTSSFPAGQISTEFLIIHGHGKSFLINKTKSPFLSSVQAKLVTDKFLSGELLKQAGLPVAPKRISTQLSESDIDFLNTHSEIVVKPNRMDRGVAVTDRIQTQAQLETAFTSAAVHGPVILEKQITGKEYRILVINGKAVAALERKPLTIKGDGTSTLFTLITRLNQDPRRGYALDRSPLRPIRIDKEMEQRLQGIGLSLDSVIEKNVSHQISFSNHLDSGGIAADCTDKAHPDNLKLAENAARLFHIDVAGIDLICNDIMQPIHAGDTAAILEVNPGPDIIWHLYPAEGNAQPVADLFIQYIVSDL